MICLDRGILRWIPVILLSAVLCIIIVVALFLCARRQRFAYRMVERLVQLIGDLAGSRELAGATGRLADADELAKKLVSRRFEQSNG